MRCVGLAALVLFGAAAFTAGRLPAQSPMHQPPMALAGADQAAIRQVITAQIEAFRHNDAAAAFKLASPTIRLRFGNAPHFLDMVRQAYPPVFRPRSFRFGAITAPAAIPQQGAPGRGMPVQKVELVGPDGNPALALYTMEHEPDGTWRIAACSLVKGASLEI